LVELDKAMQVNTDADYVEIIFANEQLAFSKGFSFILGNSAGE
jgi:hypothetical protein